jgi:integrase
MDSIGIRWEKYTHGYHIIRHSVGSLLHKRTGDVKLVQELLGHARIETTSNVYIHVDDDSRSNASELLFMEFAEVVSEGVN